ILAGGAFTSIGGQTRNGIARLDATTGLADSFNPNANGPVYSIAVQADGKILAGGAFRSNGGTTRHQIAGLDVTTRLADTIDPTTIFATFGSRPTATATVPSAPPYRYILAGGAFTSVGGQTRNNIARLDATAALANSFNPNANSHVYSIAVQADGKILAGGTF